MLEILTTPPPTHHTTHHTHILYCPRPHTIHIPLVLFPVLSDGGLALEDVIQSDQNAQGITDTLKYCLQVDTIRPYHLKP